MTDAATRCPICNWALHPPETHCPNPDCGWFKGIVRKLTEDAATIHALREKAESYRQRRKALLEESDKYRAQEAPESAAYVRGLADVCDEIALDLDALLAAGRRAEETPSMNTDNSICGRCGHPALDHANFGTSECQTKTGCTCYEFLVPAPGPIRRAEEPRITFTKLRDELCQLAIYRAARTEPDGEVTFHDLAFKRSDVSELLNTLSAGRAEEPTPSFSDRTLTSASQAATVTGRCSMCGVPSPCQKHMTGLYSESFAAREAPPSAPLPPDEAIYVSRRGYDGTIHLGHGVENITIVRLSDGQARRVLRGLLALLPGAAPPEVPAPQPLQRFSELLADLRELESLYATDRVAHTTANQIERIFDKWLYGASR